METLFKDVRYGIRSLLNRPAFTAIAVITLALGIGANTAIFSVVNAVLLRPLAFERPNQLVFIDNPSYLLGYDRKKPDAALTGKHAVNSLEQAAYYDFGDANLSEESEAERAVVMRVTSGFFPLLGVKAALGRVFTEEETRAGSNRLAVISHSLWQRRYHADSGILGQTMKLNGQLFTIVGVMPAGFEFPIFPSKADLWVPLSGGEDWLSTPYMVAIGRIKIDFTLKQAQAEMNVISQSISHEPNERPVIITLVPMHKRFLQDIEAALAILFAAVGCVLLIACVNTTNLLLARAATRAKEIAIRSALGATRWRLVRQWLVESVALAVPGGLLGLLLAQWGIDVLLAISPVYVHRADKIRIDGRVLGFTLLVSLVTGVVIGLVPGLQLSKPDLIATLKEGGVKSIAKLAPRLRQLLIISEIALALMLLIGAGLLCRSFIKLMQVEKGFDPHQVLTFEMSLPKTKYQAADDRAAFYGQVIARLNAIPGMEAVGGVDSLPVSISGHSILTVLYREDQPRVLPDSVQGSERIVTADYFRALGIPLLRGRAFTERDQRFASPVAIISERLARKAFPDQDPLGRRLVIAGRKDQTVEIIGVVADVRAHSLTYDAYNEYYLPYTQQTPRALGMALRARTNLGSLIPAVKQAVHAADPGVAIFNLKPMEQVVAESVSSQRFSTLLLGVFAGLALLLTVIGVYGVMAFVVTERTHEIGIRVALGAQAGDILKLVVRQGMTLAVIGLAVGLAGGFALTRLMTSLLFGVAPTDATTFAIVSALLILVALLACYVPARRAARVDPLVALR